MSDRGIRPNSQTTFTFIERQKKKKKKLELLPFDKQLFSVYELGI